MRIIDVIGLGCCNEAGQYPMYEINGKVVDIIWLNPWGLYSRCNICEINGDQYYVMGLRDCDQYGRFNFYEVAGEIIAVNWIDYYQEKKNSTNEESVMETYFPSFFPQHFFRNIGITLALLIALLSGCANDQFINDIETNSKSYYYEESDTLIRTFLKSKSSVKISQNTPTISNLKVRI